MSAPTSKSVQWVPINLTEGSQGCLACPALLLRGSYHQRPARGVKLPTSHRAIAHSHREPALGLILTDLLEIRNTISSGQGAVLEGEPALSVRSQASDWRPKTTAKPGDRRQILAPIQR